MSNKELYGEIETLDMSHEHNGTFCYNELMSDMVKIVVMTPLSHSDAIRQAIGDEGGGTIGNYSHCSFSTRGIGRYKPLEGAKPMIGSVGEFVEVEEERIEFMCDRTVAKDVIEAIKKAHPYEEVAIDVFALVSEAEV